MTVFAFPDVHAADRVIYQTDESSPAYMSIVIRVKPNQHSIDLIFFTPEGGRGMAQDVWYKTDPRIHERPDVFRQPGRGIFDLADSEKRLRFALERLDQIEKLVGELGIQVENAKHRGRGAGQKAQTVRAGEERPKQSAPNDESEVS